MINLSQVDSQSSHSNANSTKVTAAARMAVLLAALLATAAPFGLGQALPAAEAAPISTGFALPTTLGTLQYAVSASESLTWGYYGNSGAASATNLSGDLGYISNSKQHPFSLVFAGGHSWATGGQASYSFASLGFSQVANVGRWDFTVSDNVSYLPSTPATGLSGVPGVGDLGVNPVQVGPDTGQGVLTNYSDQVTNTAAGSVQRQITGKTSFNASGSYSIMRFLDSPTTSSSASGAGLDNNSFIGGAGVSHQIDARNSLGGNYAYSSFSYPANNLGVATPGFASQTVSLQVMHKFTRMFTVTAEAGPEWTTINAAGDPSTLSLFANVVANYTGHVAHVSLAYTSGSNAGYGAIAGALSSSVNLAVDRTFARVWSCAATSAFTETSSLPEVGFAPYSLYTFIEAGQVSRAIMRSISVYASYTLEDQSNPNSNQTVDLFSGISQVVGFGLTYSPGAIHLGRQ